MNHKSTRLLLILAFAVLLAACGGTGPPVADDSYTAEGAIVDRNETPVPRAALHFSGDQGTAETGDDGRWTKAGLQGTVVVTPMKEGYEFDPPSREINPTFARQVNFVSEPTSLAVIPEALVMHVDETQEFSVTARDKYGQRIPVNAQWLVTGGIGTASPAEGESTVFTATTPGEGTVVAEHDDIVSYGIVTVLPRREEHDIMVTHNIDATPVAEVGGSVAATIDDESYHYGIIVTLTAVPDEGWRFVRWEGDYETDDATVGVVVIDREREPVDPFGVALASGEGYSIRWEREWNGEPVRHHPEIVAYGDALEFEGGRTDAGDLLEAKFGSRTVTAVFEKE